MGVPSRTVLIGGEAGQGLQTIGDLLTRSLVRSGYHIVVTQDYMSRIRGGHNTFAIRVSAAPLAAPNESVDLLLALDEETVRLHREAMTEDGVIVGSDKFEVEGDYLKAPFRDLAEGKYSNVAALGVAGRLLGLDREVLLAALEKAFGKKGEETAERNAEALNKSYDWASGKSADGFALEKAENQGRRLIVNGNDAVALGAAAAGIKFCAFYPMTPSTSVPLNLAKWAGKLGLAVEQAEDEIAAINMCIGASFAGAPSLVATSGGGFALMTEGVSLAGMTETPVLIFVGQRPGPATGLPTRTEQADLEFVLHSGHGEFPRAVFAPGSVEECFHLTRRAAALTEKYQTPVFLLSDQFLADSYQAVEPFDLEGGPTVDPAAVHDSGDFKTPYRRYAVTDSGISPRLLPCRSEHLVCADSDEHDEEGHIIEAADARVTMHDKRLRKAKGLLDEVLAPEYHGEEAPELLLVCWGSTKGSVIEASQMLRDQGSKTAVLHFSQVWPLAPDQFLDRLEGADRVVGVEGNAFGQLARLLRRETGFHIGERIGRHDGRPITPQYVLRELDRL